MTISSALPRVQYPGTGSVGPFAFPFKVNAVTDLLVTRGHAGGEVTLAYPADYTVTGIGNASLTVTLTTALASGDLLTIRRSPTFDQPMSIRNQGSYFPAVIEDETDRIVMQLQALKDRLDRSFGLSEAFDASAINLNLSDLSAGKVLTGTGTGFTMSTISTSGISLPGEGRTVATASAYLVNGAVYNIKDYGAIGDGNSHPLSGFFGTLAAAQAVYPHALALSDEIDWAAKRLAVSKAEAVTNGVVFAPHGLYLDTYTTPTRRSIIGEGWGTRFRHTGSGVSLIKPITDDGITLFNFAVEGVDTTGGGGASAIFTTYDTTPSGLIIDRVFVNGQAAGKGFASGVTLENTQGAIVRNCRFRRLRGTAASNAIMLSSRKVDGGNLASANALVLPASGNSFRITGTTQINSITDGATAETVITLAFAAGVVVQNSANIILLAGANYTATAEVSANYPHDFIILQKVSAGIWKQVAFHPLTCNDNIITDNDIEFETGPTDAEKMGYSGIAVRAGGSFNIIARNRIKGATGAQITLVSTTQFVDACRHNDVFQNRCLNLDGKAASAHANQEAAIELGGRMIDNRVDGNKIFAPVRWGILLNEDGTYKSHYRTRCHDNFVWRATREGIMNLGSTEADINDNTVIDCSQETANTFDGIQHISQPLAGAETVNTKIARNRVQGARHRYGINIAVNSGIKPQNTTLENNIIPAYGTAPVFDGGDNTIIQDKAGTQAGPFDRELKGYKGSADNTTTAFLRITILNKTVNFSVMIRYTLNSNSHLRVRSGFILYTGGRFAGNNASVSAPTDTAIEQALAGGSEAFTTKTFSSNAVAGAAGATQTIDLTFLLDSDSNTASNLHYVAQILSDSSINNDPAAEVTIAKL